MDNSTTEVSGSLFMEWEYADNGTLSLSLTQESACKEKFSFMIGNPHETVIKINTWCIIILLLNFDKYFESLPLSDFYIFML